MVSYPTDDSRSLVSSHVSSSAYSGSHAHYRPSHHRAPPSSSGVSSAAASTVRRHHHHRHGRPHVAGSSGSSRAETATAGGAGAVSNEFPVFTHTGDVEIIVVPDPRVAVMAASRSARTGRTRRDSARGDGGVAADERGGGERRYLLHRLILAQCSGFFEAGTSDEWAARDGGVHMRGGGAEGQVVRYGQGVPQEGKRRWRYVLEWPRGEDELPILVQKDPSTPIFVPSDADTRHPRPPPIRPKPQPPPSGFFRSMANLSALNLSAHTRSSSRSRDSNNAPPQNDPIDPSELIPQAYDNLFRIFYNYPPALDSVQIARAYVECKALLQAADVCDALDVVGARVDHHLLRFGARLWKQIAKYPPSYLKLGYLARSRAIFAEAVVHVVGSWPACAQQLGYTGPYAPRGGGSGGAALPATSANGVTQLPEQVFELIEDKVDDLEDLKAKVEAKLWRLTLTTSRGERVNPSNAWLDWLAMSLFRQWLAENTTPPPMSILKDSSASAAGPRAPPSSRGSTSAGQLTQRFRSSSRSGRQQEQQQQQPPPSFNAAGSVLSASSASAATTSAAHQHAGSSRSRPSAAAAADVRHPLTFNTGRVFRLLGGGGGAQAYLTHPELKTFLKLHPENYDRDKLRRFERRVDELKNLARDAVKPLMRNFLEADVVPAGSAEAERERDRERDGGGGSVSVGYLTCTRVGEGEFPWEE